MMGPAHYEGSHPEEEHYVKGDTCHERHDKLDKILFDSPEGVMPRLRRMEMNQAVLMTKFALVGFFGSIIGGGLMALIVDLVERRMGK